MILRLTRGRFSLAGTNPILLLKTTGAKSGVERTTPLFYLQDDGRYVLIASRGGHPNHPAWYHNLRAKPEATLLVGGREITCSAYQAEGDERERLWKIATDYNPGYDTYQARVERRIPVMVLTPGSSEPAAG